MSQKYTAAQDLTDEASESFQQQDVLGDIADNSFTGYYDVRGAVARHHCVY